MSELKNRGVADILIAVVDGLKGFPYAINAVFPETVVETCIMHLIRNSMSFASWKDRKPIDYGATCNNVVHPWNETVKRVTGLS